MAVVGDLTLDTGALIAVERGVQRVRAMIDSAIADGRDVHVPPGVLAQAWRGGPRQARLAKFLDQPEVTLLTFDPDTAKVVGVLVGATAHTDVVDVHVVLNARLHDHAVMTSDPDDMRTVDPDVAILEV